MRFDRQVWNDLEIERQADAYPRLMGCEVAVVEAGAGAEPIAALRERDARANADAERLQHSVRIGNRF